MFFALWPAATVRDQLDGLARDAQSAGGGRAMRRENLHQTLVFVGSVAGERIAELESAASRVNADVFDLEFGVTGYWRHNRILWAAPLATPEPLAKLVSALEHALEKSAVDFDRRPYTAHVTLVRDARAPVALPAPEFTWPVREFVLVESGRGARGVEYRVVARWPLADRCGD
jgi:2'-5' RNA ligase